MHTDHLVGKQIDAFAVQERIGKGGMATVYRAYQSSINRSVALKVISLDSTLSGQSEFRERFAQEAKTIAALEHPHILPIYDYGIVDAEYAYIAMRLLRGGSLAELLANHGALPIDRTVELFTQVARALASAHSKGVIHRDLKPSNIMLDESGNAYLTDFGLAKIMENSVQLTKSGNIVGTPAYMSPEQLRAEAIDQRSDIYGMGCILYHMVVGRPPFEPSGSNMLSVIYQHLEMPPKPPREHDPNISPEIELIVLRALAKRPEDRYQDLLDMTEALNHAVGRSFTRSSFPSPRPMPTPVRDFNDATTATYTGTGASERVRQPRPVIIAAISALAVVALGVIILLLTNGSLFSPAPQPAPTVLEDEVAPSEESQPSAAEIESARRTLGENGFIAYITCTLTSQYHAAQTREIGEFAEQFGLSYRVYDSNNDAYTQVTMLERARAEGASALIVCPLDIELLDESLRSADAADIPLVLMSSGIPNYGGVLMVGDDYRMGYTAGAVLGEILQEERDGQGRVVILDFPELPILVERANGLEAGVKSVAPDVEIVGRYRGALVENGEESVRSLLAEGVAFDAILSINDAGAYGAIRALEEADVPPGDVIISSVDAEPLAQRYIRDGYYLRASVEIGREQFSHTAINAMVKLLAGSTVPEMYLVPPGDAVTAASLPPPANVIERR